MTAPERGRAREGQPPDVRGGSGRRKPREHPRESTPSHNSSNNDRTCSRAGARVGERVAKALNVTPKVHAKAEERREGACGRAGGARVRLRYVGGASVRGAATPPPETAHPPRPPPQRRVPSVSHALGSQRPEGCRGRPTAPLLTDSRSCTRKPRLYGSRDGRLTAVQTGLSLGYRRGFRWVGLVEGVPFQRGGGRGTISQ